MIIILVYYSATFERDSCGGFPVSTASRWCLGGMNDASALDEIT